MNGGGRFVVVFVVAASRLLACCSDQAATCLAEKQHIFLLLALGARHRHVSAGGGAQCLCLVVPSSVVCPGLFRAGLFLVVWSRGQMVLAPGGREWFE
jgi:hypothetical protein